MKKIFTLKKTKLKAFKMFLVMLLVLPFTVLQGQTVFSIVGNGTTFNASTGYPSPYGNWYYGSRHQMFVSATEMIAAGMSAGINIKSLGFNIASINSGVPHQNWQVTVYTTTATNPIGSGYMTTGAVSTSTPATATGTVGWNHTTLSPFIWNGTDNLVIQTCFVNTGGFTQNYSTYWTTTLPGSEIKTRYEYQDLITTCPNIGSQSTSANTRPNIRFEWEYLTPCNSAPGANSVVTPTFQVCPNYPYGNIGLANSYTVGGLTYQWFSSTTSNVGPFTPVGSGGSGWVYSVPGLTTTTWYQAVITCTNTSQSYTTSGGAVVVAATTTNSVPYFENFDQIGVNNRLPNCSWWAPNIGTSLKTYTSSGSNNRTPRSGTSFAAYELPSNNNMMYTNGIWMEPGITYSAATHYATEYFGYSNWSNLSILVGPNQTPSGLQQVATVAPAISGPYKVLGGTFTVPSPGFYYVAIRANGSSGSALYLMIDDISVTIPCTAASANSPTLSLSASATTVCAGTQLNLTANGAGSYSWSNGATGSNIVVTPMTNTTYTVIGTNTLTNCSEMLTQPIVVNPAPDVFVVANKTEVCAGQQVVLSAYGASSYVWSNSGSGQVIVITPTVTGLYTVVGLNSFGCSSTGSQQITVKPLPNITAASSGLGNDVCADDMITLTGSGGVSYNWHSSSTSIIYSGNPINVNPGVTTTYTVFGTGANGCLNKNTITQNVVTCVGLENLSAVISGLKLFPNPTSAKFNVELTGKLIGKVEILDLTGRVISSVPGNGSNVEVDISSLSNGIYYAKVTVETSVQIIKVVKQ